MVPTTQLVLDRPPACSKKWKWFFQVDLKIVRSSRESVSQGCVLTVARYGDGSEAGRSGEAVHILSTILRPRFIIEVSGDVRDLQ